MKKKQLFELLAGLQAVGNLRGVKFVYAAAKNTRLVKEEVEALQAASQPDESFVAFEKARLALCTEHATKTPEGKPRVNGGSYAIDPARQLDFDVALEKLKGEHASAVKVREQQVAEFNAMLEEQIDIKLHKVKLEELPTDITAAQMTAILDMVED